MWAPIITIIAEAPKKCMPRRMWPKDAWCVMNWSVSYASAAGTHEQRGAGQPPHGAAKMGAVDGEGGERILGLAAEPRGRPGGDAGPGKRGSIDKGHLDGRPDRERLDAPDGAPRLRLPLEERGEQKADEGDADD